ncbi:repressor LexA [Leptospira inadai serovar Lyme str. 10]|uniref:LexA repressor n=2 Tax=Leptospira inadai serovar Lyme TaxID=293084 RepID=V6HZF7_9LEPT|nr:transcriptional repressor LexA [Leptospira inadai]EQA38389.1 repressor LexA [Leptospira inadai serovar Lyme str. 10]PNV74280.1 transcriptional repressor LexA [Leptospira inadai serovar Lyme]
MKDLTEKQLAVLHFITNVIKERGFPPTIREIGDEFGITAKGAYDHLKAIEKKGYLKTSKNQSRAIELMRQSPFEALNVPTPSIPLIGRVAAGLPILAEENIESYIPVPEELASKGMTFALKVQGDSMVEAGISDGDIAIIQKRDIARNGEIVVALIDDEATLKVYYKEADHVRLEARNAKYKPIKTKKAVIIGKLIGLYRVY